VYALWLYFEATGDWEFILNYGAEIAFEVAQFLASRVHFNPSKKRYEIIRVLGPDEYHENVDNNVYTNYLTQFALKKAAYIYQRFDAEHPRILAQLLEKTGVPREAVSTWVDISTHLYLPRPNPDTYLIEQFDGYFSLEDITPQNLRKRLINPEEYWGWPNGIAVETQVLKQADLLQLFTLLDDLFPVEIMRKNYLYYEPRTEHGSSLSPSVHGVIAAMAELKAEAQKYFYEGAGIDLYNASKKVMSGGSFLGGIHTAAAGGVWQMVIKGFAGFKHHSGTMFFKPALPQGWGEIRFKLITQGQLSQIELSNQHVAVKSSEHNNASLNVQIGDAYEVIAPGEKKTTTTVRTK